MQIQLAFGAEIRALVTVRAIPRRPTARSWGTNAIRTNMITSLQRLLFLCYLLLLSSDRILFWMPVVYARFHRRLCAALHRNNRRFRPMWLDSNSLSASSDGVSVERWCISTSLSLIM